jgi:hypothetical protein
VGRQRLELARVVLLLEVPAALDRVLALLARHAQAELEVELHLGRVPDAAAGQRAVVEARLVDRVACDLRSNGTNRRSGKRPIGAKLIEWLPTIRAR